MPRSTTPGLRRAAVTGAAILVLVIARGLAQAPPPGAPHDDGKAVYDRSCANCHGAAGRGDGPAAALLDPVPRDFTRGVYKFRSTAADSIPTDEDLARAVTDGLPGTSMPAFKSLLSDAERAAVVAYIKRMSPRFLNEKPAPITLGPPAAATADSVAKGKALYSSLGCAACHGDSGTTAGAVAAGFRDDWGHEARAVNLTEPWTFRGGSTPRDIAMRLKTGVTGSPMPAFAATDQELWQVADYVASLARKPAWAMNADELKALYAEQARTAAESPAARGRYLVESMGCVHCHTPSRADGSAMADLKLAGGSRFGIGPYGDFVSANLTSDKDTGLGNWSDGEIKQVLTRGTRPDGSRMLPFPMGWPAYAHLADADLNAIIAYLRTVPPVVNKIPPPAAPNIVSYLIGKFRWLILKEDPPIVVYAGNAGSAGPHEEGRRSAVR